MSLNVLVVEDDREIRALLQSSLSVEGFEVQTAVSLSEARALLRHRHQHIAEPGQERHGKPALVFFGGGLLPGLRLAGAAKQAQHGCTQQAGNERGALVHEG